MGGGHCQCPFALRAQASSLTPRLLPHRYRWEAHFKTKELSGTSPAHTCMPWKVGYSSPSFSGGGESSFNRLGSARAWLGSGGSFTSRLPWFCPTDDSAVRCEQLDMLQDWLADFRKSTSSSSTANPEELVAFDIVCGDLNFDNCSSGKAGLLPMQGGYWGKVGDSGHSWQDKSGSSENFLLPVSTWVGYQQTMISLPPRNSRMRSAHTLPKRLRDLLAGDKKMP